MALFGRDDPMLPVRRVSSVGKWAVTEAAQLSFADLSGDHNPLHVDATAARRTMFGSCVVHGVHVLLRGIACSSAAIGLGSAKRLSTIRARFPRPVRIGDVVEFALEPREASTFRITGSTSGDLVLDLLIVTTESRPPPPRILAPLDPIPLEEKLFADLAGEVGRLAVGVDAIEAAALLSPLPEAIGCALLAELLAITRLVGMRCPGTHSILGQLDLSIRDHACGDTLAYEVRETDDRFSRVEIGLDGPQVQGSLRAFVRPAPVSQLRYGAIRQATCPSEFAGVRALVIGGSRGLGETIAKIVASGGGAVTITYSVGEADARRVMAEIAAGGGECRIHPFTITPEADHVALLRDVRPTAVYFCASPPIFGRRRGIFAHDLLREFMAVYVVAFGRLLDAVVETGMSAVRILYPSSVAVDSFPSDMTEYAIAKQAGEALCEHYRQQARLDVRSYRLPRLFTDQTATLVAAPSSDTAAVALAIVRELAADRDGHSRRGVTLI